MTESRWPGLSRVRYVVLWVFEILAIVGLVLALTVPGRDNTLKEYIAWKQHPTSETYKAFLERQRQEQAVGFIVAIPFGIAALFLPGVLRKYRRK